MKRKSNADAHYQKLNCVINTLKGHDYDMIVVNGMYIYMIYITVLM